MSTHSFSASILRALSRLANGGEIVLISDFDGTLAEFCTDPMAVVPYPGVVEAINRLNRIAADSGRARVVISTGRRLSDMATLLKLEAPVETWGFHGKARHMPGREPELLQPCEDMAAGLQQAIRILEQLGLGSDLEIKLPFGIAVHWRSLIESGRHDEAQARERQVRELLTPIVVSSGLEMNSGHHMLELQASFACDATKGRTVETVFSEKPPNEWRNSVFVALGDDLTDENMFRRLQRLREDHGTSVLSVLVRTERENSASDAYLPTLADVVRFLEACADAIEGS
jgi:trehalose 6-phosphate phosphatase